jgi:hypothetical protein
MTARRRSLLVCASISLLPAPLVPPGFTGHVFAQSAVPVARFVNTLMPHPTSITDNAVSFPSESSFSYTLHGNSGADLSNAAVRLMHRLEMRSGIQMPRTPAASNADASLVIQVLTSSTAAVPSPGRRKLPAGCGLTAHHPSRQTDLGALHGMETL